MRWETGPFAEQTRVLLAAHREGLDPRLQNYDALASKVRQRSESWVITHGEPHRGNVIVDELGALRLVDWDTTLVAPRERDLWMVLDEELTAWEECCAIVGDVTLDAEALELYRQWRDLADIAPPSLRFSGSLTRKTRTPRRPSRISASTWTAA